MKKRSEKEIAENSEFARIVIKHLFGKKPRKVNYKPMGRTNFVFEATVPEGEYIVRISRSAAKFKNFTKEQWAVARVKEKGIPVAEIMEVGNDVIPLPYMVQKKLDGQEALYHPDKKKVLRQMGEYTSLINTINTNDYGKVFDWSENKLSKNATWHEFLENELELMNRLQILEKYKMMSKENLKKLKNHLEQIGDNHLQPVLNHGDMRRKNVMVNDKGYIIAIIDWEECCSNPAPYWELSIALHDLSVDDKQFFLEGYGIPPKEYAKIVVAIKALNLINYAPIIEDLAKGKDKHTLDFYRLRLSGDFDLYSL